MDGRSPKQADGSKTPGPTNVASPPGRPTRPSSPRTPRLRKVRRRSMEFERDEVSDEVSEWSECHTLSAPPSWSPAAKRDDLAESVPPRRAKRRSISDLSPMARMMTPETLKLRGLGRPWETGMERLSWQCGPTDAAELEEARRLCLIPTPELQRRPTDDDHATPQRDRGNDETSTGPRREDLQKSFTRRVTEASLCLSPDSDDELLLSPLFSPTRRLRIPEGIMGNTPDAQPSRQSVAGG